VTQVSSYARSLRSSRNLSPPRSNVTSLKGVCVRRLWHKPTSTQYFHIFPTGCHSVKWFIHFIWWHHKRVWRLQGEISNLLLHCDRIPWSECSQFIKPDPTFSTARFLHRRYKTCISHFIGFDGRKSLFPFLECIRVGHLDDGISSLYRKQDSRQKIIFPITFLSLYFKEVGH